MLNTSKGTILVVDDAVDILILVKSYLERNSYTVYISESPTKALKIIKGVNIDILISDLRMPEMNGIELINRAKQQNENLQCIVITAYSNIETAIEAMKSGSINYIHKPFSCKMLLNSVENGMEKIRMQQAIKQKQKELEKEIKERKQAQSKLMEGERRYREIIENTQDIINKVDENGKFVFVNHTGNFLLGINESNYIGKSAFDFIHPDDKEKTKKWFNACLQQKLDNAEIENRQINQLTGSIRYIAWKIRFRYDKNQNLTHADSIGRDITEKRQAEKDVRDSQQKYKAIVKSFDGFIYICDKNYKIIFMNDNLIERTGYNAVGDDCYKALHERDSVCPWCVNDRVFKGKIVRWETQSPKDNRWYYIVNTPIVLSDGTLYKQSMIHDITERKKIVDDLKESEKNIKAFLNAFPNPSFMIDKNGKFLFINNATVNNLNIKDEDPIGKCVYKYLPPEIAAFRKEKVSLAIKTGKIIQFEDERDGYFFYNSISPILDDKGEVDRLAVMSINITEQKKMESKVKKATADVAYQAGISEMAISVMHNIGNAINSISNRSNLLKKNSLVLKEISKLLQISRNKALIELNNLSEKENLKDLKKLIDMTEEASNALNELMNERFLKYSSEVLNGVSHIAEIIRIQQANVMGKKMIAPIHIRQLLENCIKMNEILFEKYDIRIDILVEENIDIVKWPNNPIIQLINNLLTNSLDAIISRKKENFFEGIINIKAMKIDDKTISISIIDNGCGFNEEQSKKIFSFGYSAKTNGTGLGLHWAANFVQSIGGNIKALSNGRNQGAVITIVIPMEIKP